MKFLKQFFLLFTIFSSTNFLSLKFFAFLPFDIINLFLSFIFIIYSLFNVESWKLRYFKSLNIFLLLFILAFLLSSLVAHIDWGQDFITTFITSRNIFWLFFGLYLVKSKTKLSDLYFVFNIFSWVYIFFGILIIFFPPLKIELLFINENNINKLNETIFIGLSHLLIIYYFSLSKFILKKKISSISVIQFFLILTVIFSSDNRATIFTVLILTTSVIILYSKLTLFKKIFFVLLLIISSYISAFERINTLVEETQLEIIDQDNPRIRGLNYFYYSFSKSSFGFFLGNGVGSQKVEYGKKMLILKEKDKLYLSDLGLFSMFIYFGIFSLLSILIPGYRILMSNKEFLLVKLLVLHIFISWTYFSFLHPTTMVLFISTLYIFDYNNLKLIKNR